MVLLKSTTVTTTVTVVVVYNNVVVVVIIADIIRTPCVGLFLALLLRCPPLSAAFLSSAYYLSLLGPTATALTAAASTDC